MKRKKQIRCVYTTYWTNNEGFTYISILLSFLIIFTTLPLLIFFLSILDESPESTTISVQQFFHIIQKNQYSALTLHIHEDRIYYQRLKEGNEEQVVIEQYKSLIRQKVDNSGHEVYLQDVDSFSIEEADDYFTIQLKLLNGDSYEKTFAFST